MNEELGEIDINWHMQSQKTTKFFFFLFDDIFYDLSIKSIKASPSRQNNNLLSLDKRNCPEGKKKKKTVTALSNHIKNFLWSLLPSLNRLVLPFLLLFFFCKLVLVFFGSAVDGNLLNNNRNEPRMGRGWKRVV